jgi:hypothetical protein
MPEPFNDFQLCLQHTALQAIHLAELCAQQHCYTSAFQLDQPKALQRQSPLLTYLALRTALLNFTAAQLLCPPRV